MTTLTFKFGNIEVEAEYDPSEDEIICINNATMSSYSEDVLDAISDLGYDTAGIIDLLQTKCQEQAAEEYAGAVEYGRELSRSED